MKLHLPKTFSWGLYIIPIILVSVGLVVIYSLTYYNNKIELFHSQIIYATIGFILMIFLTFLDYRNFKALAWVFYLLGLGLLIAVLFFGKSTLGATRWLDLGPFQLQPSEFMKLFLIFILAKYFSDKFGEVKIKDLIIGFIIMLIPAILVLRQPDFGSFSVLAVTGLSIILFSRIKKTYLLIIGLAILLALPTSWIFLKDYQRERIYTFINPTADRFGSGYNVMQSTITVGSGGLLGRGLGHGPQSQLNFLPVAHTDFIFAGLAEASGFVGSTFVIILFVILIFTIVNVAKISKDSFGMLVAVGIATMILFQVMINIGMNLGIMPVTGIPLPFISHGGSSLILNLASLGILQSVYLRHKKITF